MSEFLGKTEEIFSPDKLIAGNFSRVEKKVKIKSGSGVVVRGTLLGEIVNELGAFLPDGGNTGNGTISNVAMKTGTKNGTYKVIFVSATVFYLESPKGYRVGEGVAGVAFSNDHLDFLMTVGGTPWIVGDFFTIAINIPAKILAVKSEKAFVDGSNVPDCVLGADVDATATDVVSWAYATGELSEDDIVYGSGHTKTNVKAGLREKSIFLTAKDKLNPSI